MGVDLARASRVQPGTLPGPDPCVRDRERDEPATLNVTDLKINTSFTGGSSGGQLAGIRFNQAGGSVTDVEITGVTHGNGVQEGHALYIRNKTAWWFARRP